MSSQKKRAVSANFRKSEEKGTAQRSRPTSARSNASARSNLSNSRSDVSDITSLSVTGIKSSQSRPSTRQRQSLNVSVEKNRGLLSNQQNSQNGQSGIKPKPKVKKPKDDIVTTNNDAKPIKNDFYNSTDPDGMFGAEEDYHWWEDIPKEISFSPSSSLSYPSSRMDNTGQRKMKGSISSSVRNPSLNDFLDFPDETKAALAAENSPKIDGNYVQDLKYSDNNRIPQESSQFLRNNEPTSERSSRKRRETPRETDEHSQKNANFSSNGEQYSKKAERESWNADEISRSVEQNSERTGNSREAERPMKSGDFSSNISEEKGRFYPREEPVMDKGVRKEEENAALVIQRRYRGYKTRRDVGHSAVQKVLEEKRTLREQRKKEEDYLDSDFVKQRRRDEKARLARLAAIQELNEKRAQKKEENKRMVEDEMKFLEESGKVIKAKNKVPKRKKEGKKKSSSIEDVRSIKSSGSENHSRPGTANTLDSKVEELFQGARSATVPASSQQNVNENISEANTSRTEKTAKTSGTKSTLDDLFESLRQLEEDPTDVTKKDEKTDLYDWLEKSGSKTKDSDSDVSGLKLTQDTLRHSSGNPNLLSQEKLRNIMSFLDEVEQTDQDTIVSRPKNSAKTFGEVSPSASMNIPRVDAEKELALLESASAAASDVTNAMMSVKVELDEKKKTNELLQRALNQQREFTLRQARDMEKDAKQRLELQRQEYESTIQRHLSFIDQLIDDKKILSERCEELVKKLKETDKKYVDKIQTMEQNHAAELKKQKDIMTTAEKLRREKWVKEKSQQIKELTVKGLEPDIQKLIAKHKAELKKLKSLHQAELLECDERAGRKYLHQIEEIRDQFEREKEAVSIRERELAQTRFQKQMEEEEQSFQQQRRRLYAEIQEEKERVATQAQKQRKELDELKEKLENTHKYTMENVESSSKRSLDELEQKHSLEMKELKERLEIEKQQWIENYMKKQDAVLLQKERELKEGVRESRDKEIELVIRRLEEETALARDECERAAENRIKRVRDKYESEIKELEKSEKTMHEKYSSVKERSNEFEEEVTRLRSALKNEERKMEDLKKLTSQLQDERGQVVDIIRQEFADRLVTTDEDNKRLKIEMSELRAKHRLEVERITNLKEEEMEEVHRRVKQAISKKEETLNGLRQQKESAEKRADHLEFLLQEQRKKLLS